MLTDCQPKGKRCGLFVRAFSDTLICYEREPTLPRGRSSTGGARKSNLPFTQSFEQGFTQSPNRHTPMNFKPIYTFAQAGLMLLQTQAVALGADQVVSKLLKNGGQVELDWHGNFQLPVSA